VKRLGSFEELVVQ